MGCGSRWWGCWPGPASQEDVARAHTGPQLPAQNAHYGRRVWDVAMGTWVTLTVLRAKIHHPEERVWSRLRGMMANEHTQGPLRTGPAIIHVGTWTTFGYCPFVKVPPLTGCGKGLSGWRLISLATKQFLTLGTPLQKTCLSFSLNNWGVSLHPLLCPHHAQSQILHTREGRWTTR